MSVNDEYDCRNVLLPLTSCAALWSMQCWLLSTESHCLVGIDVDVAMPLEQIDQILSILELADSLKHNNIPLLNSHCGVNVYCLSFQSCFVNVSTYLTNLESSQIGYSSSNHVPRPCHSPVFWYRLLI